MDNPRTQFWYHCTIRGQATVVECGIGGVELHARPSGVKREDEYRLCEWVMAQHKIAREAGRVSEKFVPAPSPRGWKRGYRYEHYHWTFGEIPAPDWLVEVG